MARKSRVRILSLGAWVLAVLPLLSQRAGATTAFAQTDQVETSAALQAAAKQGAALRAQHIAEQRTEQVLANLEAVREILDIGLAGDDAGQLLREARTRAPNPASITERVSVRERELAEARLDRVRLLERRRLSQEADELTRLPEEIQAQAAYLTALVGSLDAERELLAATTELVGVLDSRLLWIASAPSIGPDWGADVLAGALWLASPPLWLEAGQGALREVRQAPIRFGIGVLLLLALAGVRRRLRGTLPELAASVGKYSTDSFITTGKALGVTVLMTLPVPFLLAGAGALLLASSSFDLAEAAGTGLIASAAVYLLLDIFRQMCRDGGLADAHFGWNRRARKTLQVNLAWLLPVEVLAAFVVATTDTGGTEQYRLGLGRLAFMCGATGVMVFVGRVFRPQTGVFAELISRTGWPWRMRHLWYGSLVAVPAFLIAAASAGYYFTASEIQTRFFVSGLVVLFGIVGYSTLKRWVLVTRRRLAVEQAREKLAQQREAKRRTDSVEDGTTAVSGEAVPELDAQTIDVTAASAQTLALIRTLVVAGVLAWLWAVWSELLPALAFLEGVELTPPALDVSGGVLVPAVTAWALLLAILTAALTFVAARNLPALIDLAALQRFSLDHGARYAAGTLTRYAVVTLGVIIVSRLVGIDWSRAQWIIAALGVGLGFGLQEIVANFVSGIIILFERPIRVGDTVTVGDDSGTVSKLRIRATTITDWDNKEILVPNKNFITDRVVNWTLSNPVTRLLIRVGVAYGTDDALAQKTIAEAVKSVPAVLEEPPFSVLFVGFGESSLDFEVRVFVPELSMRLPTLHELNVAINRALREAGIEIPFPQHDLHLRSSDVPVDASLIAGEESAPGS